VKVFLTGATGVMGRSTTAALVSVGHEVVSLVRSAQQVVDVQAAGAIAWRGDLFDPESLRRGMAGCDVVANLATKVPIGPGALRPGSLKEIDRIRMKGSRVVVEAAMRTGVGRIIQQSLSFIYADQGDDWIDEHSLIDVTRATEPVVVAEDNMRAFASAGGSAVSLRFGLIAGADRNTAWAYRRAAKRRPIGLGDPDSWMHVVHPDDVGTAVLHALDAPGGVYNVGAQPITRRAYVDAIAQAAGQDHGRFMPGWVERFGAEKIEILTRSQRVSSQLFTDRTGWQPRWPVLGAQWFHDLAHTSRQHA
jgi:nucleoside-diphosphate-sugar epimerase